jgi:hypothetical protein
MQHRLHLVFLEGSRHYFPVSDAADDQRRVEHGLAESGVEIVQHQDLLAPSTQLQDRVTADVAGAAGD